MPGRLHQRTSIWLLRCETFRNVTSCSAKNNFFFSQPAATLNAKLVQPLMSEAPQICHRRSLVSFFYKVVLYTLQCVYCQRIMIGLCCISNMFSSERREICKIKLSCRIKRNNRKCCNFCCFYLLFPTCVGTRRKRGTQLSPFKVPDGNSIFLLRVNEREDRKEVCERAFAHLCMSK